ncbi:uncharacterized protein FTJAE_7292 [Fusarium tjaetaba]|uniref:Uncharacterized protein n=1 Tax=Fusarium tjaetaba TaxID=1567544 RepID=A0A8H5RHA1_9HYPO|nr:uncharacterized protein FTJAE_7292 [Fusarium tjaetaba]KAF5633113.1 hypothetical protein FTJAE_7292 [Fusarium tjaetaba]
MAAAAFQAAGTIAKIAISFIEKDRADSAAQDRQNQIMGALNGIQNTLQSMQVQQENLADIGMLYSSLTLIEAWKNEYPTAVQNRDTDQINSYLQAFNIKGEGGAGYIVQNIFSVLTGQGQTTPGQSGATPLVQVWHDQSYDKMYTPDTNGQFTFTLKNYLDDLDQVLGWVLGEAGFALICQIIALQDLAHKTTAPEEIENEVEQITNQFTANANDLNYQDEGSNLTNWFRMWRTNSHVKNYNPIAGGPNPLVGIGDPRLGEPTPLELIKGYAPRLVFDVYPAACDEAEGIYPEVEFRFDETDHPLKGLATIYSRAGGLPLLMYNVEGRQGLTTTTDPNATAAPAYFSQVSPISFNVLPVSTQYSQTDAPAFVLVLSQGIDTRGWAWDVGSASPLAYWILRDDGALQTTWVRTLGSPAVPPGQQSSAATGPNPVDNGQHPSHWLVDN